MNRRTVLSGLSGGALSSLAGCVGQVESVVAGSRKSTVSLGESIEHDGVEISVDDYTTTDEITIPISFDNTRTVTPPPGAVYLLIKISVANVGDNEREFPYISANVSEENPSIRAIYADEQLESEYLGAPEGEFRFNGESYITYGYAVSDSGGIGGAYPGVEASGWQAFVIADGADPAETTIEIDWQDKTSAWTLSE